MVASRAALAAVLLCAESSWALSTEQQPSSLRKQAESRLLDHASPGAGSEFALHNETSIQTSGECGMSGFQTEGGWTRVRDKKTHLKCNTLMSTDCTVTYEPMQCPDDCPYIAPNEAFACLFQCVEAKDCSDVNPDRALPHAVGDSKVCRPCGLLGCSECRSPTECKTCHQGFDLESDNTCKFKLEKLPVWKMIVYIVEILAVVIIVSGIAWTLIAGANESAAINMYSIQRSRRNRKQVKTLKWNLEAKKDVVDRYPLSVDVHTENICGMGLALFYNSSCFTILVTLLFVVASQFIYNYSGVHAALDQFELDQSELMQASIRPAEGAPASIVSRLVVCASSNKSKVHLALKEFTMTNFYGLGMLYVLLFLALVAYTFRQKTKASEFDARNATMSDFVLRVTGLPEEEVDEPKLRNWFQEEFQKVVPDPQPRPQKYKDGGWLSDDKMEDVPDSKIKVHGVSICYNYSDSERWTQVDDMIQKMMVRQEVNNAQQAWNAGFKERQLTAAMVPGGAEGIEKERLKHMETVQDWFNPKGKNPIKSCGEAFIVFTYMQDRDLMLKEFAKNPDMLKYKDQQPLQLFEVTGEPPSVNWWHMGVTSQELRSNIFKSAIHILGMILAVQVLIIMPYAYFYLWPFSRIGSSASGLSLTILGIVIGNINMIISIQIWMTCYNCGFRRKESMDTMVLMSNIVMSLINNLFNIGIATFTALSQNDATFEEVISMDSMVTIGLEHKLGKDFYNLFVPGYFFVGFLMTIVMAGIWPFTFNTFLMKLIYVWGALPPPLLRIVRAILPWAPDGIKEYPYYRAEKALEPMEIQIGDYANLIVLPFLCSMTLLIISPYTPKLLTMLLAWAVFYYFFLRYMHLRFCKKCFYTKAVIDNYANMLWGLPLSVVAMAWCLWGIRAKRFAVDWSAPWHIALLLFVFALSMAAWLLVYYFGVDPWNRKQMDETSTEDVVDLQANLCYSWFNCNPVYVLKSLYVYQDENGVTKPSLADHPLASGTDEKKVRFFTIGKEYLFLKPERQHLAFVKTDAVEFETYLEMLLRLIGNWGPAAWCAKRRASVDMTVINPFNKVDPQEGEDARLLTRE